MTAWARRLAGAGLWAGAAAALGWFYAPTPKFSETTRLAERDTWQLPSIPARRLEASRVALAGAAPYWGMPASAPVSGAAAAPVVRETWRLAGVVGTGPGRQVLVVFGGNAPKPPALMKVGDRLPTGHLIRRINAASVCVQIDKKEYELGLESTEGGP
jgi:hypothetical protein